MSNEVMKTKPENLKKIISKVEVLKNIGELTAEKVEVIKEVKDLGNAFIQSDDKSSKEVYDIIKKAIDNNNLNEYKNIVDKAIDDNNKVLENPNLSKEEQLKILDSNQKYLEQLKDLEEKKIENNNELVEKAIKQDEKNKEWKKVLLGIICGTIVIAATGSIGYKLYEKR